MSDDKAWRVLNSRTLLQNPWFAVRSRDVRLPDGTQIDFQSIEFQRPAVAVIPRRILDAGRRIEIMLIRQYRITIDKNVWALPSGGVDAGEASVDAAARELREETGLRATSLRPIVAYHPSYGASNQLFEVFLADDPVEASDDFDRNEVLEVRWFDRSEVLRMLFENEILDGLSSTPLALLFLEEEMSKNGSAARLRGTLPGNT